MAEWSKPSFFDRMVPGSNPSGSVVSIHVLHESQLKYDNDNFEVVSRTCGAKASHPSVNGGF